MRVAIAMLGLCLGIGLASPAMALTTVEGTGSSRATAMDDANRRAEALARQRHRNTDWTRCVNAALASSCTRNASDWLCRAHVKLTGQC